VAAIVATFGGIAVWSMSVPISSAVVASGKVVVASKRKEIQHLDGGIVNTINSVDGDVVKAGDVLFELDDTEAKARYGLSRAAYLSALTAQARLTAERDGADDITFPAELLAEAAHSPEIQQGILNQRNLFEARRHVLAGQIRISMQKIAQIKEQIVGLISERKSAAEQSELAGKELVVIEDMFKRGYLTRQRVHAIRRECAQLEGNLGQLDASIAKSRKEIGETELSIQQLTVKNQSEVLTELKDIEQRIFDLKETYLTARAALGRLTATAPVSGVVVNSRLHTIGGVVRAGETVLEIVPGADPLVVEARVRPTDVDEVANGQLTEVRFTAFKQRTTPFVSGTILRVSADAVADERTGEFYYSAIVGIPPAELARLGHPLQPGMPAEILIKTGNRTALAYLAQPLLDSMNKALREQ
jgi:HlyD family secretion protein/epimerase transport system membrane fusion protein